MERSSIMANKPEREKLSTYLDKDVLQALRLFSATKQLKINFVIESALRKCLPGQYFNKNNYPFIK